MSIVCRISDFHSIVPHHTMKQEQTLEWQATRNLRAAPLDRRENFANYFRRFAVSPSKISQRSTDIPDFDLDAKEEDYFFPETGEPASLKKRMNFFRDRAVNLFEQFYGEPSSPPDHLIHVSCTGYIAPSAGQILVNQRSWPTQTINAYHMGCYGAFPAIRIGQAFASERAGKRIDIIHTEMCTLHMNTSTCSPEQILISSLFGDGYIKYNIHSTDKPNSKGYSVLALRERIVKDSAHMMTWIPGAYGFEMTLSRDVPIAIRDHIREFVSDLCNDAGVSLADLLKNGYFAVHPGGPKIIDLVKERLELSEEQVAISKKILFEHGNMSSATLPHVWAEMLEQGLRPGSLVLSVAFGPGLTVYGGIFRV